MDENGQYCCDAVLVLFFVSASITQSLPINPFMYISVYMFLLSPAPSPPVSLPFLCVCVCFFVLFCFLNEGVWRHFDDHQLVFSGEASRPSLVPPMGIEALLECKLCLIALSPRQNHCFHKRNALPVIKDN